MNIIVLHFSSVLEHFVLESFANLSKTGQVDVCGSFVFQTDSTNQIFLFQEVYATSQNGNSLISLLVVSFYNTLIQ